MSIVRAISGEITTFKAAGGWIAGLVAGILAMTSVVRVGDLLRVLQHDHR